jgi:hypothetical protein
MLTVCSGSVAGDPSGQWRVDIGLPGNFEAALKLMAAAGKGGVGTITVTDLPNQPWEASISLQCKIHTEDEAKAAKEPAGVARGENKNYGTAVLGAREPKPNEEGQ